MKKIPHTHHTSYLFSIKEAEINISNITSTRSLPTTGTLVVYIIIGQILIYLLSLAINKIQQILLSICRLIKWIPVIGLS